jgi:hypothetical protein
MRFAKLFGALFLALALIFTVPVAMTLSPPAMDRATLALPAQNAVEVSGVTFTIKIEPVQSATHDADTTAYAKGEGLQALKLPFAGHREHVKYSTST